MTKRIVKLMLVLAAIVLFNQSASAQLRTFLGVDAGPKWDVYRFEDQGEDLYTKPFRFGQAFSVNIGQEVHPNIRLETGFSFVEYGESYRFRNDNDYTASSALTSYQIPLRMKATLGLGSGRNFRIMPTLGYVFGINNNFGSSETSSRLSSGNFGTFISSDSSNYSLTKTFHMIQTGLTLEFQIQDGPVIALGGNYFSGLNRLVDIDVAYIANGNSPSTADVYSNGSYYTFTLGFYYPISRIWTDDRSERDWER